LIRFAFDQHRLERLNAQSGADVGARFKSTGCFANHFFEDVPNDRLLPFNHFARLLDGRGVLLLLELVVNERLEQFQRHLLRQTALVQL
jgi:hypothetical protein